MSKAYLAIDGKYGEREGGIYIYDEQGEVLSWTIDEWIDEPDVIFVIFEYIQESLVYGTTDIRKRLNKWLNPDHDCSPDYDYEYWHDVMTGNTEAGIDEIREEWDRGANIPTFFDLDGIERTADWWFGFPPTTPKFDIWHWVDEQLPNGLAFDIFAEKEKKNR